MSYIEYQTESNIQIIAYQINPNIQILNVEYRLSNGIQNSNLYFGFSLIFDIRHIYLNVGFSFIFDIPHSYLNVGFSFIFDLFLTFNTNHSLSIKND